MFNCPFNLSTSFRKSWTLLLSVITSSGPYAAGLFLPGPSMGNPLGLLLLL